MRIKILVFCLVVVVVGLGFIPYNKQVVVNINASYINCYNQLFSPQKWKNWNPEISKAVLKDSSTYSYTKTVNAYAILVPGQRFFIKQLSSNTITVTKAENGTSFNYSYTILSNSFGLATKIVVGFKTNLIKSLISSYNDAALNKTGVNDLKKFMEDKSLYYGFDIKTRFRKEKKMIVKSKTIATSDIYLTVPEMLKQVQDYILGKHLRYSKGFIIQYRTYRSDSLKMMVGVPVDTVIITDKGFSYMHLPSTRVLTAMFKGKYSDRSKIYQQLQSYLLDRFLHAKIAPLEVFEGKFPANENEVVNFQLDYPIF